MLNRNFNRPRRIALLAIAASVVLAAACSDFLVAENPGAVEEPDVTDPAYITLIANGSQAAFQDAIDDVTYWNGQFTDEIFNREVFIEEGQIDRRETYPEMTYLTAFTYNPLQRARFTAEDGVRRMKIILADTASRDIRVARGLAYAGMTYVYLGEMNCVTPIDLGVPKSPAEMFADAITRFEEAITIATAARAHQQAQTTPNAAIIAGADSIRNFALVGAARAALNRDEKTRAVTFATQVSANFEFRSYYSDNTTAQHHRTFNRIGGTAFSGTMTNTPFLAKAGDPRLPRVTTGSQTGKPLSPPSYSTFNNTVAGAPFAATSSMRIASTLEAQYIIAEADGPTAATLAFVDARRAAGLQSASGLAAGDPAIMAELREQRSRDFYLDNHRLGDLRRYRQFYSVDLFPRGPYPGSTTGQIYSADAEKDCWPLPLSEINGNPNI
jgi:starch-binding outer membrane protein, SusD/RagB family